ncbi:MAG: DUF1080 domain-containing protein [Chthonomonas sp.]|nr:DUF1080 domain-containing protein [Chthonomonas sp.]
MLTALALAATILIDDRPGFSDTPIIPGTKWRVHDKERPHPRKKNPVAWDGKPVPAPMGAVVPTWSNPSWKLANGDLQVQQGANLTKEAFGSGRYHIEWRTPVDNYKDQGSGNSGVFLMGEYEIQILNCFNNVTYADGHAGSIYGQTPPSSNPCRPQGEWQTYDIDFVAPVFAMDGSLKSPATVTLVFNGVRVLNKTKVMGQTAYRAVAKYAYHAPKLPLMLQDHGSPVEFRNIWVVPK